ncbi:MAG: hypothetical protein K2W96_15105 [Gemmataceae bacterium]|nr:hypothetical protein [Gemmataceae bacterium]
MTGEVPLVLPGSRVLPGWWRDSAALAPVRLWYAHLVLHRVECLAEAAGQSPEAALAHALLGMLAANAAVDLPRPLLDSLCSMLRDEGLLDGEEPTEAGRALLARGDAPTRLERRAFRFVAGPAPHFIALAQAAPLNVGGEIGLGPVEECVARPDEWKARHGFPLDVRRVVRPPAAPTAQDWPRVVVSGQEQAHLLLVESAEGVAGSAVQPDGWTVGREPVVRFPSAAELAEACGEVPASAWKQAWAGWCQQRSLPTAEVEDCQLSLEGARLVVAAPPKLVERLRQARSDALKGEAWLIAGTGRLRGLARIDLGT